MAKEIFSASRRSFIKKSAVITTGLTLPFSMYNGFVDKDLILGHGDFRYKVDINWGVLDSKKFPVKDCHEMVYTKSGNIIMLTNDIRNNIIKYNKDGKLLSTWGNEYPGGHGLTLKDEGGEEFLYLTDTERHEVVKTTMDGKVVMKIAAPKDLQVFINPANFQPTETAISESGDIYIADGYGSQLILVYGQDGQLKNYFGGVGEDENKFFNAHGIAIDTRRGNEKILVTARQKNQLKYFTPEGKYESTIDLGGAFICRPVIKDDNVYLATIWSGDGAADTGFVSILDKDNELVSAPGGNRPIYQDDSLSHMHQTVQVFRHPHDVCIDEDDNVYVCQWNAGQTYPIKMTRV